LKIAIDSIQIKNRIRKDYGDIDGLAEGIRKNDLLQPIVVTPELILIAGERRLMAVKQLGWIEIDAVKMAVKNYEHQLNCEIEENENRKDFTPEEKVGYTNELLQVEKIKAEERKKSNLKIGNKFPEPLHGTERETGEAKDIAAKKVGFSRTSYDRAKTVVDSGDRELIDQMNSGKKSIRAAYEEFQAKKKKDKPAAVAPSKPEIKEKEETPVNAPDEQKEVKKCPPIDPADPEFMKTFSIPNVSQMIEAVNRFAIEVNPLCYMRFRLLTLTKAQRTDLKNYAMRARQTIDTLENEIDEYLKED
jgi:ParB family chromosome partitioning protein